MYSHVNLLINFNTLQKCEIKFCKFWVELKLTNKFACNILKKRIKKSLSIETRIHTDSSVYWTYRHLDILFKCVFY